MLQQHISYVENFMTLREWAFAGPDNYNMVKHVDKRPTAEHVRRYKAVVPGPEDGDARGREIILRRSSALLNT